MSAREPLPTSARMQAARTAGQRQDRFRLRMRVAVAVFGLTALVSFLFTLSQPGV